jgi:phospholipid/cholesterol/gamma-HCH transport system substrate-binding protein
VRSVVVRPLTGFFSIAAIAGIVVVAATMFQDGFAETATVTVISPRAGLVMNPDAKVQFRGVQVGNVSSIEQRSDGNAAIELAIDPSRLDVIPANVAVDISSTTLFGAKYIQLIPPEHPSPDSVRSGQVLDAQHVMLEANTLFEQLVSVLSTIQPEKLNETLGAIASAMNGRGQQIGQSLTDLNAYLMEVNPHLGALSHDFETAPPVLKAYADAAPNLLAIADDSTRISKTLVDKQHDLDAILIGTIGLADLGNQVLTENRQPLTDALHLLVPTTDLTNQYNQALTCGLGGIDVMANNAPLTEPGVEVLAGFMWGQERYRYPGNLPKVAATGGPQCTDLPKVPFGKSPPFVITDTGANPWKYANPGIVLNSDGLKQLLFGPSDGPPRNSAQIGQPG